MKNGNIKFEPQLYSAMDESMIQSIGQLSASRPKNRLAQSVDRVNGYSSADGDNKSPIAIAQINYGAEDAAGVWSPFIDKNNMLFLGAKDQSFPNGHIYLGDIDYGSNSVRYPSAQLFLVENGKRVNYVLKQIKNGFGSTINSLVKGNGRVTLPVTTEEAASIKWKQDQANQQGNGNIFQQALHSVVVGVTNAVEHPFGTPASRDAAKQKFQTAIDKAKQSAQNALDKFKAALGTVMLAPERAAVLLAFRTNYNGMAAKIYPAVAATKANAASVTAAKNTYTELVAQWKKFGGNEADLKSAIVAGGTKKSGFDSNGNGDIYFNSDGSDIPYADTYDTSTDTYDTSNIPTDASTTDVPTDSSTDTSTATATKSSGFKKFWKWILALFHKHKTAAGGVVDTTITGDSGADSASQDAASAQPDAVASDAQTQADSVANNPNATQADKDAAQKAADDAAAKAKAEADAKNKIWGISKPVFWTSVSLLGAAAAIVTFVLVRKSKGK